jgi:hypothetical protein
MASQTNAKVWPGLRIKRFSRPFILVLQMAMLTVITAFGTPDVPLRCEKEEEAVEVPMVRAAVSSAASRFSTWRALFDKRNKRSKRITVQSCDAAREIDGFQEGVTR